MIPTPIISQNFSIEDIRKIREYNFEVTKNMTSEEFSNYYKNGADRFEERMLKLKYQKNQVNDKKFSH